MKNKLLLLVMMCVMTITVFAMPARKGGVIVTQPDGTELTIYQHGDEHFHWVTNENGDWLTKTEDGFYKVTDSLTTDKIIARRKASPRQIQRSSTLNIAPRGLIILVNFKDLSFSTSKEDMVEMLTGVDYTRDYTYVRGSRTYEVHSKGSARQYFFDASNGQYNPQFDVFGPVTVSQNMAYYGGNDYYGNDLHPELMVAEACELADRSVDFSQYDNDGDGVVDFVYVFYAGFGEADGGDANTIWPHQWAVSVSTNLRLDGKKIDTYACSNELDFRTKVHTGIGTFCHEFSHVLGLPDMYATDGSTHKTLGNWSIMDYGSYNNESNTPPTYSAYERFFMGWLTPRLMTEPENVVLEDLSTTNEALLVTETDQHNLIGNDPNPTTVYLLENRQQMGWDEYLLGHGLMLTKIQYNSNKWYQNIVNNNAYSMGVDLIEADGNDSGNPKAGDLFPAGATEYTGIANHPIKHIREKNGVITFSYKNAIPDSNDEPDDEYKLLYSSSDGNIVTPYKTDVFGANIVNNTIINGQCVITFDGPVTNIGDSAFYNCRKLTSITIPNGVMSIGNSAFYYSSVSSITIPESVTNIGESAFDHCSMTSITIPNSVTYIGGYAFSYCTKLISVTLPNSITSIEDGTFGTCKSLASITIPNSVTSIGKEAFENCSSLTSITIPNSVTNIGDYAFCYCSSLEGITIPISVDSLGSSVFQRCSSLSSVIWNAEECVSTSASLFTNCNINSFIFGDNVKSIPNSLCSGLSNLTTITIPNSVESIGNFAFRNCSSLTSLVIPATVIEIGGYAFAGCSSIASITCNADTIPSIARSTFNDVDRNIPLYVPCGTLETYKSASGWKEFTNIQEPQTEYSIIVSSSDDNHGTVSVDKNTACETIISATTADGYMFTQWSDGNKDNPRTLTLTQDTELVAEFTAQIDSTYYIYYTSTDGNIVTPYATDVFGANIISNTYENGQGVITFDGPVTSIGDWAFIETKNLKTMKLPNSVTIIGENAFYECESLTSIIIPNSVKDIDAYAFGNCSSLSSLTMPTNITAIKRSVFDGCSSLTLIEIPHSVTSIESWAFANCSKIESITIYNGLTSIGDNAFRYCSALKSITIPNSVVKIEHSLFFGCTSLSSIAVETGNQIYDSRNNCNAIIETSTNTLIAGCKATIIPNDIVSIGEDAFVYCHSLSSIEIPNGVINIGEDAFCNCGLKSIFIPSSVRNIEGNTFVYCDYLSSIVVDADNKVYDSRNNCNAIMETSTNRLIVGCKNTVIPSNTKIIGSMAFQTGGILYDTIVIPDGVTSIEDQAFYLCEKLSKVYLPASLSFIGKNVFAGCDSLKVVHVNATIPPTLGENVFKYSSPTCIVPCGTLAAYQASDWANQVGELVEECGDEEFITVKQIQYTSSDANIIIPNIGYMGELDAFGANIVSNTYENGVGTITFDGPVTRIGYQAFSNSETLTSITLPDSIYSIDFEAFRNCDQLKFITIPDGVYGIWDYAFGECDSLVAVNIPASVEYIGSNAFNGCYQLASVEISEGLRQIGDYAFSGCSKLTSLSLPSTLQYLGQSAFSGCGFSTFTIPTGLTTIPAYLFMYCQNLQSVTIPENITTIEDGAFSSCQKLWSIDIPNSVTSIGYGAFNYSGLWSVELPENITIIEPYTFANTYLESITIPNNATTIKEGAFSGCGFLKSVSISNSVDTIESNAFYGCYVLDSITIPKSVTNIDDYAFGGCVSLKTIVVEDGNTTYDSRNNCNAIIASATNTLIVGCQNTIIPNTVKSIGSYAFAGQTELTNIVIPNSVTEIAKAAFSGCSSLVSMLIPNSVVSVGYGAFSDCSKLKSITLPNSVKKIEDRSFYNCSKLVSVIFGNNVDSIGDRAFEKCLAIKEIYSYSPQPPVLATNTFTNYNAILFVPCDVLSNYQADEGWNKFANMQCNKPTYYYNITNDTIEPYTAEITYGEVLYSGDVVIPETVMLDGEIYNVTRIGDSAFYNCSNLTSISIPRSITNIGKHAMDGCVALYSANIPDEVIHIDEYAFSNCVSLETIFLGNGVVSIGDYAFHNCISISSIAIPNSVTNIANYAFSDCQNLSLITIGSSILEIGEYAFNDCIALDSIYCYSKQPAMINENTFSNYTATLFVPCSSATNYQNDNKWSLFSDIQCVTTNLYYTITNDTIAPYTVEVKRNPSLDWNYSGDVVIPKTVMMNGKIYHVTGIGEAAFKSCNSLSSVVIPNTIKKIGREAFGWCRYLPQIIIPNSVTEIGEWAFANCYQFTSIVIPESVTNIGEAIFTGCHALTSVVVENNNTTYDSRDNCNAIIETATNTLIAGCQSTIIPNTVMHLGNAAFDDCESLTSIIIPSSVITIGEATFNDCDHLKSITIPHSVKSIGKSAFDDCTALSQNIYTGSVENWCNINFTNEQSNPIYYSHNLYIDGKKVENMIIPNTVDTIGDYAFVNYSSPVIISDGVDVIGNSAFKGSSFTSIIIPNSVTGIGNYAFALSALDSIIIPENVMNIGEYAFYRCSSLVSASIIGNAKTTIGNYIFQNSASLISATIGNGVTSTGMATFAGCSSLTSVTFGNSVTTIGGGAFKDCIALKSMEIPENITTIGSSAFNNCTSLSSVVIPESVTTIEDYAFYTCTALDSIKIPNSMISIGSDAFQHCTSLTSVYLGNNLKTINSFAFDGCTSLNSIQIPDSVTSIGDYIFRDCSSLGVVSIGRNVTNIGTMAFENCKALDTIYCYPPQPPTIYCPSFNNTSETFANYNAALFVPCDALDKYKSRGIWGRFTNIQCLPMETVPDSTYYIYYTSIDGKIVTPFKTDGFGANIVSNTYENGQGVITFDGPVTSIGDYAFNECNQLWTITLPESVTRIGNSAFDQCVMLSSINLPESIISIGSQAFFYCIALNEIIIPKSVTSIEYGTFNQCSSLRTITIHENITSIGNQAFERCSYLDTIYVEATIPPTLGSYAFDNRSSVCFVPCGTLTAYQTSDWGLQLTNIDDQCSFQILYTSSDDNIVTPTSSATFGANIVSNTYENGQGIITFDGPVTKIGAEAFSYCKTLTSIVIPKYVNTIEYYAFSYCDALAEISVQEGNMVYDSRENCNAVIETATNTLVVGCKNTIFPNSVICIGDFAFRANQSLTTIIIPEGITSIGTETFCACQSLSCIVLPETLNSIGLWAFYGCSSLTSIDIPKGVTTISEKAFKDCSSVETINVYAENPPTLGYEAFAGTPSPICNIPCGTLAAYQTSDWANQVGELVEECEYEDLIPTNQIQYTTWDDEIVRIDTTYHIDYNYGVVNYYSMFGANIISNTYENGVGTITFDAPVTTIGSRVFNNSNLRTIILPNNITTIQDDAFADCGSLQSITLPRNLKSIGYGAFRMCSQLQSIEFPEGLESIEGRAFENCFYGMGYYATEGSYIEPNGGYIGSGLSISIPSSVTSIGEGVFAWCSGITSIVVDGNNTTYDSRENCNAIIETATNTMIAGCRNSFIPATVTALGYGVFYGHSIKSINIPDGVVSIGESAFAYSDIETLHVPGSVKTIGRDAFDHCDDLTTLTLSEGLETIEYAGIHCCYALKSIVFPSTLNSIGAYGVSSCTSMTSVEFLSTTPPTIDNNSYGCFWRTPCEFTVPCGTKDAYYTALNADAPSGYHIDSLNVREKDVFAYSIISGDIEQGLVIITKHATYCDDQTLSFYAEPTEGSSFVKWSDGSTDKERYITLTQDTTIIAEFSSMNCVIASGTCGINGDNLMWQLSCDSILSIMGEGEMSEYSYGDHGINPPWTEYASQIKSIVVKEGVTSIGTYAFYNYSTAKYNSLKDITIPTSLTKTGGNVFSGITSMNAVYITDLEAWMNISHSNSSGNPLCSAHHLYVNGVELEELVLPEGTTSVKEYVFYGCKGLKSLQLPNSIELIENSAFAGTGLIDLVLPEGLEVVDNGAFNGCLSLEKLYISSTVRRLGNCAFEGCDSLKGVYITDLEAWCNLTIEYSSPLTDAHHLYLNDIELTEVVFPENCSAVKNYTFEGCSYIKSIQLHDNITSIGSFAFRGCSSLESLVIPASVSYIGSCQFWDCTALKQIKFLSSTPPEISQGAVVFYRTNTDIIVPCGSKDEYIAVINSPDQELYWIDTNRIIEQQAYTYSIITSNPSQGSICYLHEPANCDDLTITFRADAANGYRFVRWSDGNTENPRTLYLTKDIYLAAEFETSLCNVNVWCDTTRGFVTGNGAYSYGTTITLSAYANEGYRFARWSDNVTENPRTITLYHDMTLRADFMECSETDLTICERELPHLWYDQTLTATGKYTYTEKYIGTDIDSIQHILNLTVNPTVYTEETMVACDSYTWNGETYTESGEYVYTTTAANGCDSIITLRLTINPTKHTEETAVACDSYSWNGQTYTESGDYTYTTVAANGCDSIVTLHLTINNSEIGATEYVTICYGDTYTWNGQTYSTEGEYSITLSNTLGCDSVATLQLTIMPEATTTTETVVIGSDELPYTWRGNTYSATGRYTVIEQYTTVACDSAIHVLDLTVLSTGNYDEQSVTICETEAPYTWYGESYSVTGKYTYTEKYLGTDIDSIQHILNLTVNPTVYTEEHITACDSYTWNGETYTESGDYTYTTVAANGCDSIVTLHLTINNSEIGATEYATICYGETYTWNGQTYSTEGEYSITLSNTLGCDSVATLQLTIMPEATTTTETIVIGSDELPYTWRGNTYSATGRYTVVEQYTTVACDSVIYVLDLTVLTTGNHDEQSVTICDSEAPYIWYGKSYSATGKYTYTEKYAGTDIDSIQHILNLTVNPTVYTEEHITACDSYTWNDETYTQSGEYVYTTVAANGCDSIVTLHLIISPTLTAEETITACDFYEWNGQTYTESGDYVYTATAANGCDSIVTLHLTINNSEIGETEYVTICYGETYTWNGQTYSAAGEYSITLSNALGCDSVATLHLTIMPEATTTTETILIGSDELPYTWRGNTYSATGRYTVVEQYTTAACDSAIHVLDLTVLSTGNYDEQSVTICETEAPYTWYGESYSVTGKYTYTEKYVGTDIDSIQHILNLTVNPTVYTEETMVACDSYTWNGQTYTESGDYVYTTTATNGCDSIVTLHLTINQAQYAEATAVACDSYAWNGETYTQSGEYTFTTVAANGCDSIVTLHLTINNSEIGATEYVTICYGETYTWNGQTYSTEGEYSITLSNTLGCDSVATLHLTIMPEATTTTETVVIGSDELPYTWRGNTYSATGRYTVVEQYTTVACDSAIHVLDLTVLSTGNYDEQSVTICETEAPYTWYGESYSVTGKYTYTEKYVGTDIDSIQHILNLTVNPTVYAEETITACDNYTWNGETYTESGDYVYTTTASNGCDSIVTLHLTINQTQYAEETVVACDSYAWNGETYTASGEYVYTTTAANGCDSIVTLHLTINQTQYAEETVIACDSYVWNGQTYTESGEYTYNTTAANGCDSIVTLHLTINQTQYAEVTATACDSYVWNGETYTESGEYVYNTTAANGCDSIVTLHLTINQSEHVEFSMTACDSYAWNGETYTQSGDYTYTTTTDQGCERVEVLHLTINKSEYVETSVTACDSYEWNGIVYTESGDYTYNTTTDQGCERVEVLHLNILPDAITESEKLALCPSELPYEWYGQWLTEAGSYTATEQYAGMDCDSIIHELTVNVYVQTLPVVVTLPTVRTGEAIDVTIPTAEIQAHIAAETWYAPNAEVAWYIMENSDWATLTAEPVKAGTTQVVLKYAVATDCGSVESDNIVIDVIPTSVENTSSQSPTTDCQKILYKDHIYILRDGKIYSIMGQEM